MSKSACEYCGAPRKVLDRACPYCGRTYKDSFDESGDTYGAVIADRGVLFETGAVKRWKFWAHTKCRLRITRDALIFEDFENDAYSFTIPMEVLKRARIESPPGFFGSSDDMLIILEDGTEYEIGLESGVKQRALEIIRAIWERYY